MNTVAPIAAEEILIKHSLNNINESILVLEKKIFSEKILQNKYVKNQKIDDYYFDFYFKDLRLAIQIDALSYSYSNLYNNDTSKLMSIPHKNITVLKVSDYQVLVDSEEVIRFLKNYSSKN